MAVAPKFLASLLLLTPFAGASDPALLDLIMPDARVVMGIDIGRIRSSPLSAEFSNSLQNANPELQKLMEAAGFDPFRDLQEILFASPGTGKNPPALIIARGMFDSAKLRAFAGAAGSKETEWQGVLLLSDPEKDSGAFALLDNLILAGNLAQVKAAVERRGRGMILNPDLATRIANVSRRYDAWLVSTAGLSAMTANLPADAKIDGFGAMEAVKNIEQFSLGISLSADLTLAAEMVMKNAKAAGGLADGIQMLMGMVQQSSQDKPETAAFMRNLNFGVEENVVKVGFTVPAAELEKAVQSAVNARMKNAPVTVSATVTPIPPAAPAAARVARANSLAAGPGDPVVTGPTIRSARIPANAEILVQSSPKDMGTVVIYAPAK